MVLEHYQNICYFLILQLRILKKYNKIIDCPSGASSFVAEINNITSNSEKKVIGCDPLFDESLEYLEKEKEKKTFTML